MISEARTFASRWNRDTRSTSAAKASGRILGRRRGNRLTPDRECVPDAEAILPCSMPRLVCFTKRGSATLLRTEELKVMAPKAKSKKKPAVKNLKVSTSAAKRVKGGAIRYIK